MVKINDTATDGAGSLIMVRWEPEFKLMQELAYFKAKDLS